jgi:aspartate kinase
MANPNIPTSGKFVAKFGGDALASAEMLALCVERIRNDSNIRYVVVSAPGSQNGQGKVTDLLIECHLLADQGQDFSRQLREIKDRFQSITHGYSSVSLTPFFTSLSIKLTALRNGDKSVTKDWIVSRGEMIMARAMTQILEAFYVEPERCILIGHDGQFLKQSYPLIRQTINKTTKLVVVPGFFGRGINGSLKTMPRSGTDLTAAGVAAAVKADLYINFKKYPGVAEGDPCIVGKEVRYNKYLSYKTMFELASGGAQVLQKYAVKHVRDAKIPIKFESYLEPNAHGTYITDESSPDALGITGRLDCYAFRIQKDDINEVVGFGSKALQLFAKHNASYLHNVSGESDILIVMTKEEAKKVDLKTFPQLLAKKLKADVETSPVSVISIISEGRATDPGFIEKVTGAIKKLDQTLIFISDVGSRSIILGVSPACYGEAVRAIYEVC